MNILATLPSQSFRETKGIDELFANAQSRHLTDEEYERYLELFPTEQARVDAAKDLMKNEDMAVKSTVLEVLRMYPFKDFHVKAAEKCLRDVKFVSIYATHAMLLNDTQWYKDKLLTWMKTILHSFSFPALDPTKLDKNKHPEITERAQELPDNISSCYECYARLRVKYGELLAPESMELLEQPLQVAVDALSETFK